MTNKKSIVRFIDDYSVIDIETTDISREYGEIIEMSALKVRNGEIIDLFSELVKPDEEISFFIEDLTGISNEMVKNARKVDKVLPDFLGFVGEDIIIGHNVSFDIGFINCVCERFDFQKLNQNYIDTMRISRRLLPDMEHHRLKDLARRYHTSVKQFHRSLADCENTKQIYDHLKKTALRKYKNLDDFYKTFKKSHKGLDAKTIIVTENKQNENSPIYDRECVFSGALEKMERRVAMQAVVNTGGRVANAVTKHTNFLILGNNDNCTTIKDGKSSKQKKAEEYKAKGYDIEIISEDTFYEYIK